MESPSEQEDKVQFLNFAQIVAALRLLSDGGTFVLKIFTFFEPETINMLFLLRVCFDRLHLFKPVTSKPGNSEVYVVALGYRKTSTLHLGTYLRLMTNNLGYAIEIFPSSSVPDTFVEELVVAARIFMEHQVLTIERNILHFNMWRRRPDKEPIIELRPIYLSKSPPSEQQTPVENTHQLRLAVTREYFRRYGVESIDEIRRLVGGDAAKLPQNMNVPIWSYAGSFTDRKHFLSLEGQEKGAVLRKQLEQLNVDAKHLRFMTVDGKSLGTKLLCSSSLIVLNESLNIRCGRPIHSVTSSKFILIQYLKMLLEIRRVPSTSMDDNSVVSIITKDCEVKIIVNIVACMATQQSYDIYEKNLFSKIVEAVNTTNNNENSITIVNWLLLTHFSVGVLWLLTEFVYDRVTLFENGEITLEKLQVSGRDSLNRIVEEIMASKLCSGGDNAILCLVAMNKLRTDSFYDNIFGFNNNLCVKYCETLLDEIHHMDS